MACVVCLWRIGRLSPSEDFGSQSFGYSKRGNQVVRHGSRYEVALGMWNVRMEMIGCRPVEMWWWLGWDVWAEVGRQGGNCVPEDVMDELGLHPEWAVFRDVLDEALISDYTTSNPSWVYQEMDVLKINDDDDWLINRLMRYAAFWYESTEVLTVQLLHVECFQPFLRLNDKTGEWC